MRFRMYASLVSALSLAVSLLGMQVRAQPTLDPATIELGRHYERLTPTQPTSSSPDKIEVAEVFWYACPHCFAFEPSLRQWQAAMPDYVNFVRIPAVWNPLLRLHAQAYYTADELGRLDEMHDAFFNEIHRNGNPLNTEAGLADFFSRHGVGREQFEQTFNSFEVYARLERADEYNRRYRISSVPTIVINGKFKTDAVLAGSYPNLIGLINALAAAENSRD